MAGSSAARKLSVRFKELIDKSVHLKDTSDRLLEHSEILRKNRRSPQHPKVQTRKKREGG